MALNRREFVAGATGAVVAAAGAGVGASIAGAGNGAPQPIRGDDGAPILGPRNAAGSEYVSGQARMTVFASDGTARTFDYRAGDVGHVPFAMGHYIENTGSEPVRFLEMFRSDHYADVSLNQWLALTPPELVRAHLNIDEQTIRALSKTKPIIVR